MLARARALVQPAGAGRRRAVLTSCGITHFLHDGFSDVIYLLLPVWQAELGLSLTQAGVLKSCYSGALASGQVPAGLLAERLGERGLLALGTLLTGLGFIALGFAGGFTALALILVLAGAGSSTQHPLAATIVAEAWPERGRRAALGVYNFTGDLGKVAVPLLAALVIAGASWQAAVIGYGALGIVGGVAVLALMQVLGVGGRRRAIGDAVPRLPSGDWGIRDARGFGALSAIAVIDGASRTAFLTLLPFLLTAKGADLPTIGVALGLTFAGGAAGKFLCGVLAERAGILRTVIVTELMTAAGVLLVLALPLGAALVFLPVVGVALNGTSSVLYATVAEFVAAERRARGFGLFYTVGIGAGALAPFLFGFLGDLFGLDAALVVLAAMICLTVPLCAWLRPALVARPAD